VHISYRGKHNDSFIRKGVRIAHSFGMVHFNKVYPKLFEININVFVW